MTSVGTSQGVVHNQRQGTGKATILQGDRALDAFDRLALEDRAKKAQEDAAKKAALNAGYERMLKFNPDHWYKHDNLVQGATDAWINQGAELMNQGIDPWKGVDEKSQGFRKEFGRIASLAMASKQLQERFNTLRGKIDGADPGKYTNKSLLDIADFFEKDPQEIMDKGLVPPELEQRQPMIGLQDYYSKLMQPLNQTRNGNPYTDAELWDVAKRSLVDPEKGDDLSISFRSAYGQMDEDERDDIRRRADASGVSIPQQMAYDYAQRYSVARKPFEYDTWKKAAVGRIEVPYKEWRGPDGFSTKVDKAELDKIAGTVARDAFVADDRALKEYEKVLPRNEKETDGKYRQRAIADLAERMKSEVATKEAAGQTESGRDRKEFQASRQQWLDDMVSGDPERYMEAAGYIVNTGDMLGNMTVLETAVLPPGDNKSVMTDVPMFSMKLAGNLTLKDVETQTGIGLPTGTEVQQRGTETEIQIPISTRSENALLTLHDKAFGQKKMAPYGGKYREAPKRTLSQMFKNTPQTTSTTPKFDF